MKNRNHKAQIVNGYNKLQLYRHFYDKYFLQDRYCYVSIRLLKKIVVEQYLELLYGKQN